VPPPRGEIGRAEFPAVGTTGGRIVAVFISSGGSEDQVYPASLSSQSWQAAMDALQAARTLTSDNRPLRVDFDSGSEPLEGQSFGLAVGVAAVSHLRRAPLLDTHLFSGVLEPSGRLIAVSGLEQKLALRRECRPGSLLALSAEQVCDAENVIRAPTLASTLEALGIDAEMDLGGELAKLRADYDSGHWTQAAAAAQTLVYQSGLRGEELLELHTVLLAAANHQGNQEQARVHAEEIQRLLSDHSIPPALAAIALTHAAIQALDLLRPTDAEALLQQALDLSLPPGDRALVHVRGTLARVRILQGDLAAAVAIRQLNTEDCPDSERARCWGDLADGYLRTGQLTLAADALSTARAGLARQQQSRRRREYLRQTARFLTLYEVRLALARQDLAQAHALLLAAEAEPQGLILELQLERASLATTPEQRYHAIDTAYERLSHADQPIYRALRLRARLQAGDADAGLQLQAMLGLAKVTGQALCCRLPY